MERVWKLGGIALVVTAIAGLLLFGVVGRLGPLGPFGEAPRWSAVNDWLYQLQNLDLEAIGESCFDLVVMDYSADGSAESEFSAEQIQALKNSPGGPKLVLAYLSIGQAESYRWYWNSSWDSDLDGQPDEGAPSWLGPADPDWPDNYWVRYWNSEWQEIVLAYLDRIVDQGFDGVYLDRIDACEYWGPGGESGLELETAERDMVELVKLIASHARTDRGRPGFGVFPQNGEALASHSDYLDVVTGIGREDTWYYSNTPQPSEETAQVTAYLDLFREAGKLVLVVDYVTQPALIDDFYAKAQAKGYVPYATVRSLDQLTINPGHEPD